MGAVTYTPDAPLNLSTLPGLSDEAENMIHALSKSMTEAGDKASLTIKIQLERSKDAKSDQVGVTYGCEPQYAKHRNSIIAWADLTRGLSVPNREASHQMDLIKKEPEPAEVVPMAAAGGSRE